jgi:hypothetical protein
VSYKKEAVTVVILYVLLVLGLTYLSSCAIPEDSAEVRYAHRQAGITRHVDAEAGVVCWVYTVSNAGGISCLPLTDTRLDGYASPD